jgi:HD-GYP domain-containing protein (c-di-GMP phosphodiesterase class II)
MLPPPSHTSHSSVPRPLLLSPRGRLDSLPPLGRFADGLEIRHVDTLPSASSLDPERPTVVVVDRTLLSVGTRGDLEALANAAALVGVGSRGELEPNAPFPIELLTSYLAGDARPSAVAVALRGAFRHATALLAARLAQRERATRHGELAELTRISVALSTERDLLRLLELILDQSRRLTTSDAGSLYLVDRGEDGEPPTTLRFKLTQNFSLPELTLAEFTVPIDSASLAGHAAATGEPLDIDDVYTIPSHLPYRHSRSFDEKVGYRTKSMLVIPMKTHRDEIIGVLQLINRKRAPDIKLRTAEDVEREVLSYDTAMVELVSALASQAAVAIENSLLYEDIEKLFEGFVTAAVTAIEARDPTTSGHSGRVATLTVGLAEALTRAGDGAYRAIRFTREDLRELRYASLLHDFGKVGVREEVLVKEKKLYPHDLDLIRHRFAYLIQNADLEFERRRAEYLLRNGPDQYGKFCEEISEYRRTRREELTRFFDAITVANEPTVEAEGSFEALRAISRRTYIDFDGIERRLLSDDELAFLMIRKGNLDDDERREIESHVTHTYRFLEQIPWTRELRRIPDIAYAHHEKLNGRGYPRQITADAIPVQTRMMTIADIFDALTATDRPYKRAVSRDRALDILSGEAREGMIDRDLLRTFIEAKIYEATLMPAA